MKSFEVHSIETRGDIDGAVLAGLLEPSDVDGAACAACSEKVAMVNGGFVPFSVVLDERDECWFVCADCSLDVLDPADSEVSLEELFSAEEEFDDFDLTDDD